MSLGELLSRIGEGGVFPSRGTAAAVLGGVGALSFLLTWFSIRCILFFWPRDFGADVPDGHRKRHDASVLRIGGLALVFSFVFLFPTVHFLVAKGWLGVSESSAQTALLEWPFYGLGAGLFLIGFAEDLFGVPAMARLVFQILLGMCAHLCGLTIELVSIPFSEGSLELGSFSILVTIAWFVAVPNLINLLDGLDGLSGGIGLFLSLTLGVLGALSGNGIFLVVCFAMGAAIAAFLVFNFPPAKIYMGDGGAYLIGYFIAAASIVTSNKGSVFTALLVVLVSLAFPILDTSIAILRRWATGLPIMSPDALHLHHRLQKLGLSKRDLVLALYCVFAGLSILGIVVFLAEGYGIALGGTVLIVGFFSSVRLLGLPRTLSELKRSLREMVATRRSVRYAHVMAQVLAHELARIESGDLFWRELLNSLSKLGIRPNPVHDDEPSVLPAPPRANQACVVVFPLGDLLLWNLLCPPPVASRREWARVIRCFQPAVIGGIARFGNPPAELGIWTLPMDQALLWEGILNGEIPLARMPRSIRGNLPLRPALPKLVSEATHRPQEFSDE